jgi:hypothetical protein
MEINDKLKTVKPEILERLRHRDADAANEYLRRRLNDLLGIAGEKATRRLRVIKQIGKIEELLALGRVDVWGASPQHLTALKIALERMETIG